MIMRGKNGEISAVREKSDIKAQEAPECGHRTGKNGYRDCHRKQLNVKTRTGNGSAAALSGK